jgi:hypothetical protein
MKYALIVLASCGLLFSCASNDAQTGNVNQDSVKHAQMLTAASDSTNYTSIQWLDSAHQDLGKIKEGQVVEISWKFKNTGTKPLIITNASASCGCTVAERPEEPVAPGAEGVIKAKFDSHDRLGPQHKQVFVESNTSGSRSSQLSFAVEVNKQ